MTLKTTTIFKSPSFYFWLFISIHTLIWTLIPSLTRTSVTHDTLEGITWGLQWQLGYSKHPFLAAWLCAGITRLFSVVGWPVYFLGQLAVALTFFATWQLAKQFLAPVAALIASLALEGVVFYTINTSNLTPDSLQSPLWALLALFFYQALTKQTIIYWLSTGLLAALCFCTKYQVVLLLIPMFVFCLSHPTARISFKKTGIYCAFIFFILLCIPHLIWLWNNHFGTLIYAFNTPAQYTKSVSVWNHISFPLRYLVNNILSVSGLFLLLWPFYKARSQTELQLTHFQWHYLLFIGLGPLILSLFLCFITGYYFTPRWSTPYYFSLGIIMMAYLRPVLNEHNLKQFAYSLILFSVFLVVAKITVMNLRLNSNSDAFLPNQEIAERLSKLWHEQYRQPLTFIAGSNYLIAGVMPYMPDQPKPYSNLSKEESPWINEREMRKQGALFIWDLGSNYTWDENSKLNIRPSKEVRTRFPNLITMPTQVFYKFSNHEPVFIGIAILPPA
ncbi:MAG: glycosyltransferase family 39 protein [Legionella sp.]